MSKGLLIGSGVLLGIILGFVPGGFFRPKPAWWKWLATITSLGLVVAVFSIPTGGDVIAVKRVAMNRGDSAIANLMGRVESIPQHGTDAIVLRDEFGRIGRVLPQAGLLVNGEYTFSIGDNVIFEVRFSRIDSLFRTHRVISVNPAVTLPLNAQLEDQARNLYFHVPAAWLATLSWFVAAFFGIRYLRKRNADDDIAAAASAAAGLLFCLLALITGALWARLQWGVGWWGDPRLVSIYATLLIFGAYFALRGALSDIEARGRLSSIYLILLALPVLFFMFVYPRLDAGMHPGSAGSGSAGPVLAPGDESLNRTNQVLFALAMVNFSMIFFWVVNVSTRIGRAALRRVAGGQVQQGASAPQLTAIDHDVVRQ